MKKNNPIKNFLSYLPVATLGVGLLIGGVRFQIQAENTKTAVKELKDDVKEISAEGDKKIEELKDKSKETEKKVDINKTQQDNTEKKVDEISVKTDKIIDLLLQMQKKK